MPQRKPGETIEQFAIRSAWTYGHFWTAENVAGWNVRHEDLPNLSASDPVVIAALRSYSQSDVTRYAKAVFDLHGRSPVFDGEMGPALEHFAANNTDRCSVPDFAPPPGVQCSFLDPSVQAVAERMQADLAMPAQGSGGWAGCHGIGNFHCAIARWDVTRKPSHLPDDLFLSVLKSVQRAYAEIGLLWRFVDAQMRDLLNGDDLSGNSVNTDCSFVRSSDGWIGLAIVGRNETCQSRIWAKFLNTYTGGSTPSQVANNWFSLIAHELGHNCGRSHTNGGIMNPSLVRGLPQTWQGDPSEGWMRQQFGGEAVPVPGDTGPPPKPPTDDARLRAIEIKNAVQDAAIQFLIDAVRRR